MLARSSFHYLFTTVIGIAALGTAAAIGLHGWTTWNAVAESGRILNAVTASGDAFKAMLNIRSDRFIVPLTWNADIEPTQQTRDYIRPTQTAGMIALDLALENLADVDFASRPALLPLLAGTRDRLKTLQVEFWAGIDRPKTARRPALAAEYLAEAIALQDVLEMISANVFVSIRYADAFVDQMLYVKQLAWMVRDRAGRASQLISQGLLTGKVAPDARLLFDSHLGGADAVWAAIEGLLLNTDLPETFTSAVKAARIALFARESTEVRERLLTDLIAGSPAEMTTEQWSQYTVPRLKAVQGVGMSALSVACQHIIVARDGLKWRLALDGALLLATSSLAAGLWIRDKLQADRHRKLQALALAFQSQAITDPLTGLYNRAKFDQALAGEMLRAQRYHVALSIILYDIDHFKSINDTFGHLTGDAVLIKLSQLMSGTIRDSDLLARWGGEEFIILAPNSDSQMARQTAERLRSTIAKAVFNPAGRVYCSFGVAQYADGDTVEGFVARADAALYRAKINGRDRVEEAVCAAVQTPGPEQDRTERTVQTH